jgi:hypothetical protein
VTRTSFTLFQVAANANQIAAAWEQGKRGRTGGDGTVDPAFKVPGSMSRTSSDINSIAGGKATPQRGRPTTRADA